MKYPILILFVLTLANCTAPITAKQAADLQSAATAATQAAADLHTIQASVPANDPVGKATGKGAAAIDKVAPVLTGIANAAAQAGATAGDLVGPALNGAAQLAPPPYGAYLGLAALVWGIVQNRAKNKATAAAVSMQSGVQAALSNGSLVASPKAAGTIDAMIVDHPIANQLVTAVENSVAVNALKG